MKTNPILFGIVFTLFCFNVYGQQTFYDVTAGNGNGIRFWQNDLYKLHMGSGTEYEYGPVTSYSIKSNMNTEAGRGWTWGSEGLIPIAALSNNGNMKIAGNFTLQGSSNPINFTSTWSGSPDYTTNVSEISNDVGVYKQLMIVGNKAQGVDRRVGIWDRLSISGAGFSQMLNVNGTAYFASNVGIGTSNPAATSRLHLFHASSNTWLNIDKPNSNTEGGLMLSENSDVMFYLYSDNGDNDAFKIQATALPGEDDGSPRIQFPKVNKNIYMVQSGGNVGIGTSSPNERLTVNGTIYSKEVRVDISVPGPDYVFEKDYRLPPLEEIEKYIQKRKHLPEIPPAEEMQRYGVKLSEMNMLLLKKVEELTLYLIDQQKQIEGLKKQLYEKK